jgi:hypothetical protein
MEASSWDVILDGIAGPTACVYKLFNTTGGFHFNSYLCIQTVYLIQKAANWSP